MDKNKNVVPMFSHSKMMFVVEKRFHLNNVNVLVFWLKRLGFVFVLPTVRAAQLIVLIVMLIVTI